MLYVISCIVVYAGSLVTNKNTWILIVTQYSVFQPMAWAEYSVSYSSL